jgi:hypothetical protein
MNSDETGALDTTSWSVLEKQKTSAESPVAFVLLPMPWSIDQFSQATAATQHALYSLACQQAAIVVEEVRRRRQLLFSRGVHLWN